ncbi:hypothetical protein HPB48_016552 [Haemaphysalis longicornis]|uniref:THAP-type domain-containing protein n=1 Tax=Haemaphysalis longicornis TaxID=44386 RepID=A0A9J6GW47_HAELO|nr:hypothetical protein HPB48_016552 [Haemaphysalis longicornis]
MVRQECLLPCRRKCLGAAVHRTVGQNYPNGPRARVYRFPSDPAQNAAWTKAVRREKTYVPTKYTVVCEHHFHESDFVDSASYTDSMTGKVIEVPLKLRRLKPSAIPSVFPNCPAYLSRQETSARESPEEKRAFLMQKHSRSYNVRRSLTKHGEEKKNAIATFEDLLKAVGGLSLTDFWSMVVTQTRVLFLNFRNQKRQLCIVLQKVLCGVEEVTKDSAKNELQLEILLKRVVALLEELSSSALPHEWQVEVVKFVTQQLQVLLNKASIYSADFMVFCSLVYTISPHAYRFIRSTAKLELPHPQTIRRICASYNASPSREQEEDAFLFYARRLASTLKDHERFVTLMMDEIHLQASFQYKGGCVTGAATNKTPSVLTASFNTLCKLHEGEKDELLRLAPTLSFKALNPSNLERQNVKLALRIFHSSTVAALRSTKVTLDHANGTLEFISIVLKWWDIVNVKTPLKGQRLRDPFQEPISALNCHQIDYLNKIVDWLDYWQSLKHDAGQLTRETHTALHHTSHALVEVSAYCIEELGFKYVLLGKFQTDSLEDRFGRYRQLCGSQYHVSIRQIYECEQKLRLQKLLDLPNLDATAPCLPTTDVQVVVKQFDVAVTDDDVKQKEAMLPAITYVAGYCAHAAVKKLACSSCRENLVVENRSIELEDDVLIANATRGGLKFPQPVVVHAVLIMEIVLDKLRSAKYASKFFACAKQKQVLVSLTTSLVECNEDLDFCDDGHSPEVVLNYVSVLLLIHC